jgi:diguanylate cyclase (GGDEF)-like protein
MGSTSFDPYAERTVWGPNQGVEVRVAGLPSRTPRPLLLVLVFGAFLAIVGITASAQALLVSVHFSTATLNSVVSSDSATVRALLNDSVRLADLDPAVGPSPAELTRLEGRLAALTRPGEIVRVELRRVDGGIVAASAPGLAGRAAPPSEVAASAAAGQASAAIVDSAEAGAGPGDLGGGSLLREFLPVTTDGQVRAVVGIWRDAGPVLARLDGVRRDVVTMTLSAAVVACLLLFLIFRSAQGRLTRQTAALVDATRRDPLTGSLNHGALVGHLAAEIERSREVGTPLAVALVDVDNFRLLNDNHGHRAGDDALLAVVGQLTATIPDGIVMGRYGPDEILLIAQPTEISALEPALEGLRVALADLSLQYEATERLPITVSAGICTYPEHGASATLLLGAVARTLEEAKASGGDAIRVAGTTALEEPTTSAFDVLQALVVAIDTKDRYTKRHSEDVSRYGVFLAEQLGLERSIVESVRLAGLLHDVGKIGIPDAILRKPGALTQEEYEIVKQHVALGDLIVRDVPDTEAVRAGIRHHHERWDGAGYLDRLAGEEIPLLGRILAVGDAFSAMTTTRPYRKALDVREALKRLEDGAGTQFEAGLVRAFVDGIEHAADPPLPLADGPGGRTRARVWTPRRVA